MAAGPPPAPSDEDRGPDIVSWRGAGIARARRGAARMGVCTKPAADVFPSPCGEGQGWGCAGRGVRSAPFAPPPVRLAPRARRPTPPHRGRGVKSLDAPHAKPLPQAGHAPFRHSQRHDQSGAARRQEPQARSRRGRESAGVAQGSAQFRHRGRPPRRGDRLRGAPQGAARITAFSARKAACAKAPTSPTAGSSTRSTAPPISCTASRISPCRSRWSVTAPSSRR